jgi:hypothetical protein
MIDRNRFRWVIKVSKENSIIWEGYIDTESYEEDYGETYNYYISFKCNDGLGLLNRVRVDEIGLDFNNLVHPSLILTKIAEFYSDLNTTIQGNSSISVVNPITSNYEEFFTTSLINPSGFIDEDGEYIFCDKVLESVLQPLNIKIYRDGEGLHYYNENDIKNNTPLKQNIDWKNIGNSQGMTIEPAINEQVVKYDNYRVDFLVNDLLSDETTFNEDDKYDSGLGDGMAKYNSVKGWNKENDDGHFFGQFVEPVDEENVIPNGKGFIYVKNLNKNKDNHIPVFTYQSDLPCYSCADGSVLKISCSLRPDYTKTFTQHHVVTRAMLKFENDGEAEYFMCNSSSSLKKWRVNKNFIDIECSTTDGEDIKVHKFPSTSHLNDKDAIKKLTNENWYSKIENDGWLNLCVNIPIPLSKNGNGKMTFQLLDSINTFGLNGDLKGILIKDLSIEITSKEGYDKSTEYKIFDPDLKYRDKKSTTVYCGTHQAGLELGQFLIKEKNQKYPLYPSEIKPIKEIKYNSNDTKYDAIEDYLMITNYNQYSKARIVLSNIEIDMNDIYPDNIINEIGYPDKNF